MATFTVSSAAARPEDALNVMASAMTMAVRTIVSFALATEQGGPRGPISWSLFPELLERGFGEARIDHLRGRDGPVDEAHAGPEVEVLLQAFDIDAAVR